MYEAFWGLKTSPFTTNPDPRFYYRSPRHEEAINRLLYVILTKNRAAAFLSGEVGSGKTMICNLLRTHPKLQEHTVIYIPSAFYTHIDFIKEILFQFHADVKTDSKAELIRQLQNLMISNYKRNKKTVVIIDEAQAITDMQIFEEIRLLLNLQFNNDFIMTLIFVGQPELGALISGIPQLEQRIAIRYHLTALSLKEAIEYILTRLKLAGATEPIFSKQAMETIFDYTSGIPRKINNLCDLCLLAAYSQKTKTVSSALVQSVYENY